VDNSQADVTLVAIAVVQWDNEVLVGQRPAHATLAGFWEFPGGKVQCGETPAEGAVRECAEETGLSVDIVRQLSTTNYDYEHGPVELHFFECQPILAGHPQTPRHPFVWLDRQELSQLKFPPANAEIVRNVCTVRVEG